MDIRLFLTTFLAIFLAELGDKTQLATMTLSAKEKSLVSIFFAAMLAFAISTLIAIVAGTVITKFIPQHIIHKIAASAFVVIGILMFLKKI